MSGTLKGGKLWEERISTFVKKGLENYDGVRPGAVFLDVGANIGTHTLYALATGHRVYAVEPLTINDVRVNINIRVLKKSVRYECFLSSFQLYHSAELSKVTSNLRLYQHTVDMERGGFEVKSIKGKKGGSKKQSYHHTGSNHGK